MILVVVEIFSKEAHFGMFPTNFSTIKVVE